MNKTIDRIKLFFLGVFIIACGAIWAYQAMVVWPPQRCEAHGDWWDEKDKVCAVPIPIWTFTHRLPGEPAPPGTPPRVFPKPKALASRPR